MDVFQRDSVRVGMDDTAAIQVKVTEADWMA